MKLIVQTRFSKQARGTGGASFVQLSVLFIGLAMAATMAFMPDQLASQILRPGAPAIGGGISEEQVLDPSVAEDPDAVSSEPGDPQSGTKASDSGGQSYAATAVEYPLRSYWWYPIAAAGGLFILLAFGGKSSNAASVSRGEQAPHHKPDSQPKHSAHQAKNIEAIETLHEAARAVPHAAPSKIRFDEPAEEPKAQSIPVPQLETRSIPKQAPKKQSSQAGAGAAQVIRPAPTPQSASTSPASTVAVTQKQMLEFAEVLSLVKEENLLSEEEYKAIHAAFQATDQSGKKWTVNLKTQGWFEKIGGKWQNATPPDTLYLNRKTNDSLLKYAKQLASRN